MSTPFRETRFNSIITAMRRVRARLVELEIEAVVTMPSSVDAEGNITFGPISEKQQIEFTELNDEMLDLKNELKEMEGGWDRYLKGVDIHE